MLYLVANLLGLIGLVGIFYLTGWLCDHLVMKGRGLEPISAVGWFGLGATLWMGWAFGLATVQRLGAASLGLVALLTLVIAWRYRRTASRGFLAVSEPASASGSPAVTWVLSGFVQ